MVDSLSAGGAGRAVTRLANEMNKREIEICIIAMNNGSGKEGYYVSDDIQTIKYTTSLDGGIFDRVRKIARIASEFKPDYLISFLPDNNIYSILAGIKKSWKLIVCERNDPGRNPEPGDKVRIARSLLYRFADGYVFQTEDARNYFSEMIQRKSVVIPNPVAPDIPAAYCGNRRKVIVSVASLKTQKNYMMSIQAFANLSKEFPEYTYEIFGEGAERENIESLISRLGLEDRVILKGHCPDVLKQIMDASLFVMSSDYEGMSNSMIEALAMGIPSIVTDHPIGAPRMLIEEGVNGLLVPVGDIASLTQKMKMVLQDKALSDRLSCNAQKIKETLSIEHICSKWIDYCEKV